MNDQHITRCSNTRTPDSKIPIPSEAIAASPGLNAGTYHRPNLDRVYRFAALDSQSSEIKTMMTNTFKLTGMAAAVTLAACTFGAGLAHAYDVATIQTYDLGKAAAHAERKQPVAPIAARPNGNAYIQWATQQDWNGGNRGTANSQVYVTEVNATGSVVGSDILLGRSQPGGLAATDTSFGYYLMDGNRVTFKVHGAAGNPLVVMDHADKNASLSYSSPATTFRTGIRMQNAQGQPAFGWNIPFWPYSIGSGDLVYGNSRFGTIIDHANTFSATEAHQGDATIFFDGTGVTDRVSQVWGTSHSLDQRIVFDASNNNFFTVALSDSYPMDFRVRVFDGQGNPTSSNDLFKETGGVIGNRAGLSAGLLGDIHAFGNGALALSYGLVPKQFTQGTSTKNEVNLALLDNQGKVTLSKRLFQAERGTGSGYTDFNPKERVRWVKSAKVGSANNTRILVFFQTEVWNGEGNPRYTPSIVRMAQLDQQGNIQQAPATVPSTAKFNLSDSIEVLSNGTLAWTHTGDGTLKLNLLAPPNLSGGLPTAPPKPTAQAASNVAFSGFTASWNAINGASSYRIDVSTDNFQTFVLQDLAATDTSHSVTGLQPDTAYQYRVRSFNNAGSGQNSNVIALRTTTLPLAAACTATGNAEHGGYHTISNFDLKDAQGKVVLANKQTTTAPLYEDFTRMVIKTTPGAVLTYSLALSGNRWIDFWIDRNNNGTLETSERVHVSPQQTKTGQMTIPADLTDGFYRLRVRAQLNNFADPCVVDVWGQAEDYTLQIGAGIGTGTVTPPTPTPAAFKAALQGAQSDKCVDVPARNTADNVGIIQWTCGSQPNQKMTFTPVAGKADVYTLVFDHSNKCLHVPGTTNGTDLVQKTCDNSTSQQFKLESVGNNLYKVTAQNSNKALDVENFSTANLGKIQQWTYGGGENQKWRVVRDL